MSVSPCFLLDVAYSFTPPTPFFFFQSIQQAPNSSLFFFFYMYVCGMSLRTLLFFYKQQTNKQTKKKSLTLTTRVVVLETYPNCSSKLLLTPKVLSCPQDHPTPAGKQTAAPLSLIWMWATSPLGSVPVSLKIISLWKTQQRVRG